VLDPPPEAVIRLPAAPVSLQGSAAAKERIREAVRAEARLADRTFLDEVEVRVEWLLHERHRVDTPGVLRSPDLDNILKPIFDGLCGPEGLLIDDCQVQTIMCSWLDWSHEDDQQVTVTVRPLDPDAFTTSRRLCGVERPDGLCWVLPEDLPPAALASMLEVLNRMRDTYEDAVLRGIPEADARYVLPIARRFHRRQLERHGFPVFSTAAFLERIGDRAQGQSPGDASSV
jgi:Holliday junction resolvase RusA-like endonuclease